jgi:hypothetical protein
MRDPAAINGKADIEKSLLNKKFRAHEYPLLPLPRADDMQSRRLLVPELSAAAESS